MAVVEEVLKKKKTASLFRRKPSRVELRAMAVDDARSAPCNVALVISDEDLPSNEARTAISPAASTAAIILSSPVRKSL